MRLAENHRVVVPDMPGWGGSERPAWARDPRDIAIIVTRLLARLELDDVKLVGLGFGGYVAAELATMNPSRLARLVLVGAAGLQPETGEIMDQMMLSHRKYIEESFRTPRPTPTTSGRSQRTTSASYGTCPREMTARVTWKPYMFNRRLTHLLGDMHVPTLIVWGDEGQGGSLRVRQAVRGRHPERPDRSRRRGRPRRRTGGTRPTRRLVGNL